MLRFVAAVKESVLDFILTVSKKCAKKICNVVYIHKIHTYYIRSKIRVMIPLRTYFWTD